MKQAAYLQIISAAAFWGCIGLFTRILSAGGMSPMSIVAIRAFGSLVILAILFGVRDRSVFRVKPRHLWMFAGTGVVSVTFFTWCYFSALEITSLAVAAVLLYTAPIFVVLLSALIWKDPFTKRKALALLLSVGGCALVSGLGAGNLAVTPVGFLLGLGAGFFYALYTIFGRFALEHYSSKTVTVYTFLFASAASLVLIRPAELAAGFTQPAVRLAAVLIVVLSTVLPYLLYTAGLSKVESGNASILACVEPAVATLISVFVFREPMTATGGAGIALIFMALWLLK